MYPRIFRSVTEGPRSVPEVPISVPEDPISVPKGPRMVHEGPENKIKMKYKVVPTRTDIFRNSPVPYLTDILKEPYIKK